MHRCTRLRAGVDGPNGVYAYGATPQFPTADASGNFYWADVVFTAGSGSTGTTIWSSSAVPQHPLFSSAAVTLGVKFRSDVGGTISGIRFYKGAGNNGTHTGLLYSSSGALLAQGTFTVETSSGWQQVNFAAPVTISANTTYVAAYWTNSGFAYDGGPLRAAAWIMHRCTRYARVWTGPTGCTPTGPRPSSPRLTPRAISTGRTWCSRRARARQERRSGVARRCRSILCSAPLP